MEDTEKQVLIRKLFIFFAAIYFIQGLCQGGVTGLFNLPLRFMLKNELGFNQEQLADFCGLVMIPWVIKPLYGILSDFIPILGYRRKSWYIIVAVLGIGSALYLAKYCNYTESQLLFILSALALSFAFADVLCDAVMVENGKPLGLTDKFQGTQWASYFFAAMVAGFGGGAIAKYFSYSQMFLVMAVPSFVVLVIAIFYVPERRYQYKELKKSETVSIINHRDIISVVVVVSFVYLFLWLLGVKSLLGMSELKFALFVVPFFILGSLCFLLRKAFNKMTFFCIGFLFWWNFSIGLNVAPFFYYQTDTLGFSEMFMGRLQTLGGIGGILGALLFLVTSRRRIFWKNRFIAKTSLSNLLKWAGFIAVICIVSNFLLMGSKSAAVLTITTVFIFQFAMLSMLVLAAEFCPKQIEGTFFALLMSVVNLGASTSERTSGMLFGFLKNVAPSNFNSNYWAKFLVWLGWPTQHSDKFLEKCLSNPKAYYDIFVQYYAIGWLIIISLGAFLLYFVLIRRFGDTIKEKKELKALDIHSSVSEFVLKMKKKASEYKERLAKFQEEYRKKYKDHK